MRPLTKSAKLANVAYDIRGPVLDKARQMQEEGWCSSADVNFVQAFFPYEIEGHMYSYSLFFKVKHHAYRSFNA